MLKARILKHNSSTATAQNKIDYCATITFLMACAAFQYQSIILESALSYFVQSEVAELLTSVITIVTVMLGLTIADPLFVLYNCNVWEALKEKIDKYLK